MHKVLLNRARIELDLKPRGGFLVKDGDKGRTMVRPHLPDLQAMRTGHGNGDETVFIPGSSLKGVFRSSFERQLRTLGGTDHGLLACDPLEQRRNLCHVNRRDESSPETHARLCLACRTFGSQQSGGRIRFADALPDQDHRAQANKTEQRSGVSIDRRSGGPARGKLFEMEVVTRGRFRTAIQLENYQLWQLGLIATLIADLAAGELRVGSATTRGLGALDVVVPRVVLWQRRGESPAGVSQLGAAPEYQWLVEQVLPAGVCEHATPAARRGGTQWTFEQPAVPALLDSLETTAWSALEENERESWAALALRRGALSNA